MTDGSFAYVVAPAGDDIIVSLNNPNSGGNDLAMIRNRAFGNGTVVPEVVWRKYGYSPVTNGVAVSQGVMVVLSEYGPDGYNCQEQCLNGFEAATGKELWGVLNTYGQNDQCSDPTPLLRDPPRGVAMKCSQLYAIDAASGHQLFVANAPYQVYGLNADVFIQSVENTYSNYLPALQGLAVPPASLIAFSENATITYPLPAPFVPPPGPPPTPAPL